MKQILLLSHAAFWSGDIAGKAVAIISEAKDVAGRPIRWQDAEA